MAFALKFHPEAEKAFEVRATTIRGALAKRSPVPMGGALIGSAAHLPIAGEIGPGDLVDPNGVVRTVHNAAGEVVELALVGPDGAYLLQGDSASELGRLAIAVAARVELRDVCDSTFVQDSIVRWLQRYVVDRSERSWLELLRGELADAVQETLFRVPLVGVVVENPISLGPYLLTWFSQQDIEERVSRAPKEHQATVRRNYQRHYQGKVCVEGRVTAVPSKAEEFALEAAADVVRGLRLVHPAAVDVRQSSRVDVYDCKRPRTPHVLLKTPNGSRSRSGVESRDRGVDLVVSSADLELLAGVGLHAVDRYLGTPAPSKLNEAAWSALDIFGRGVDSPLWRDRVIGALVAAETLLLSNSTEPIQRSLGQRIAVLLGGTLADKRQVIDDIEEAYKARSAFIHHGEDATGAHDSLSRAVAACREVVHRCLATADFATKQDLIRYLDDQLLAGARS
jgi:hypothetical protein